jgi:hypothetical protein
MLIGGARASLEELLLDYVKKILFFLYPDKLSLMILNAISGNRRLINPAPAMT